MTTPDSTPTTGSPTTEASAGPVTLLSDMSEADASESATHRHAAHSTPAQGDSAQVSLIDAGLSADYRARWKDIQGDFIDAPRGAVTDADAMVGEVLARITDAFDQQRKTLKKGWVDNASDTEQLRIALRGYRAFFERLLTL